MTAGPVQTQIILVPVPEAGSPGWARPEKPVDRRHHRAQRELWKPATEIPDRQRQRRELLERGREFLEQRREQRGALLERGRAALAAQRAAG
jgi:hypothetical protein